MVLTLGLGSAALRHKISEIKKSTDALLHTLQNEVIPLFYKRDQDGLPRAWTVVQPVVTWQLSQACAWTGPCTNRCAFIPVCAGGCLVASHTELGDVNLPTCHKPSFESALVALAHTAASAN